MEITPDGFSVRSESARARLCGGVHESGRTVSKLENTAESPVFLDRERQDTKVQRVRKYSLKASAEPSLGLVNCGISARSLNCKEPVISPPEAKNSFLEFCYDQAPVVGFRVMRNDVVTVRAARYPEDLIGRLEGSVRGKIEFLSGASRRRLALIAGNSPVTFRSFVTVSYPAQFPCDGKLVKKHLKALLEALRRRCGALEYLWFLEFQRRGAPHLHIFTDHALPEPLSIMTRKCGRTGKDCRVHWPSQDWISSRWYEIVGSGDERHLRAGSAWEVVEKPDGAARYVAKESYKTFQKQVPKDFQNVGRFWGVSRNVTPPEGELVHASKDQMQAIFPDSCDGEGNPFPVMFSASEAYEKIRDTTKDPVKFRAWNTGRSQKMLVERNSASGLSIGSSTRTVVSEHWHGSILNSST